MNKNIGPLVVFHSSYFIFSLIYRKKLCRKPYHTMESVSSHISKCFLPVKFVEKFWNATRSNYKCYKPKLTHLKHYFISIWRRLFSFNCIGFLLRKTRINEITRKCTYQRVECAVYFFIFLLLIAGVQQYYVL